MSIPNKILHEDASRPIEIDQELIAKIRKIQIRAKHLVNDAFSGKYESAFKGRGMEFNEVREYIPGDDVRHIDWNVTARMSRPFIKVHRVERDLTVIFLVDVSWSNRFGSEVYFKNEIAAEITALLAYSALSNKDKVGLAVFSDHVEHVLVPKKGRSHVWKLIRDILSYKSRSPNTNLIAPLEILNRIQKQRAVVFLISDFQSVELPNELKALAKRHDTTAIRLWDKREYDLPKVGYLELEDLETQESLLVNTNSLKLRLQYKKTQTELFESKRRFFANCGIGLIDLDVQKPYLPAIEAFLRMRDKR